MVGVIVRFQDKVWVWVWVSIRVRVIICTKGCVFIVDCVFSVLQNVIPRVVRTKPDLLQVRWS